MVAIRHWLWVGLVLATTAARADEAPASDLVERGRYLARAGDCVACHTAPGGPDFAGGLPMETPIGRIYSTNITPDRQAGIGTYSAEEFIRAVRQGVAKDGHRLYPAMPYPSYATVTDQDMRALYAYFQQGVAPVPQANRPSEIPKLLGLRFPLAGWDLVFARQQAFQPSPSHDDQWNRGAYLVQGLGHCGSCHTPRGLAFQEKAMGDNDGSAFLAGAEIDGWLAKSLRGEGLARWSEGDIATFLKTGRTDRSAAFAGMAEVVTHSTQYLADGDLAAIARYLKALPAREDTPAVGAVASASAETPGAATYGELCAACHRSDGVGVARIFPALADNSVVTTDDAASLIRIILAGGRMPRTETPAFPYAMPAFNKLDDGEVAGVVSFIRAAWGNKASPVTSGTVAKIRARLDILPEVSPPATDAIKFAPPLDTAIPADDKGAQIRLGQRLLADTKHRLPDNVGNGLNCTSCHLDEGKVELASPFVGVAVNFPHQNPRAGRVISLAERVNGCFLRSLNGKPLAVDGPEMLAILAYFDWLSNGLPPNAKVEGGGFGKIDAGLKPDPAHGKQVYAATCAECHGADGGGLKDGRGAFVFPPLWGDQSFNVGAGMARTNTAAAFVKYDMPVGFGLNARLGQGGALSDQDALDVAEYFTHQPRPDFPDKVKDWPNGGKPKDARY